MSLFQLQLQRRGCDSSRFDKRRQQLLKEFGVIELLTDIVFICNFEEDIELNERQKQQNLYIEEISKLANESIKYVISRNKANIFHCSQWFDMFIKLSIKNSKFSIIQDIEEIIMQLLKDNFYLINTRIQKVTIEKFIQMLVKYKKYQHLKILKNIILCSDDVIYKNQREITILLLKDESKRKKFLFEIVERGPRYLIRIPAFGISDLDPNSQPSELTYQQYQYLYHSTKLISALCRDRNYLAINILKTRLPFKTLVGFLGHLNDENIPLKIVFIDLLTNLYINVYSYNLAIYKSSLRYLKGYGQTTSQLKDQFYWLKYLKKDKELVNEDDFQKFITNFQDDSKDTELVDDNLFTRDFNINPQVRVVRNIALRSFCKTNLCKLSLLVGNDDIDLLTYKFCIRVLQVFIMVLQVEVVGPDHLDSFYQLFMGLVSDMTEFSFLSVRPEQERLRVQAQRYQDSIKISICKILRVFISQNFKLTFNQYYFANKKNITDRAVFQTFLLQEGKGKHSIFLDDGDVTQALLRFTEDERHSGFEVTRQALNTVFFLNRRYSNFDKDYKGSVFIKKERRALFLQYFEFAFQLERIAENCQRWLVLNSQRESQELGLYLNKLFANFIDCVVQESGEEFELFKTLEGENLQQLISFLNPKFILYYRSFFCRRRQSALFIFLQNLCCALPIIDSLFRVLQWAYKHRHFGSMRFEQEQRKIYLIIAIITFNNEKNIRYMVQHEALLLEKFERDPNFSIVFMNYCKGDAYLLRKIQFEPNFFYNLLFLLIQKASNEQESTIQRAFFLDQLSCILSSPLLRSSPKDFQNVQLYIYIKIQKYFKIKSLFRDLQCLVEESKERHAPLMIHGQSLVLASSDTVLSHAIIRLLKKLATGNNKLTKSVSQNIYDLKTISRILSSKEIQKLIKMKFLQFLNTVYLFPDNNNIFHFKDIIEFVWKPVNRLLKKAIKELKKPREQREYLVLPCLITEQRELHFSYLKALLRSIKLVTNKYKELKLSELEQQKYFEGVVTFINTFDIARKIQIPEKKELSARFEVIIRQIKNNWIFDFTELEKKIIAQIKQFDKQKKLEKNRVLQQNNDCLRNISIKVKVGIELRQAPIVAFYLEVSREEKYIFQFL